MTTMSIDDDLPNEMQAKLREFKSKFNCDIRVAIDTDSPKALRFVGKNYTVTLDRVGGYWAGSGVNDEEFNVDEAERDVIVYDVTISAVRGESDEHPAPVEVNATIEIPDGSDIDTVIDSAELIKFIDDETSEDLFDTVERLLDEGEFGSSVTVDELDLLEYDRFDMFLRGRWFMSRLDDVLAELARHFK